jgi:hypothetical protein
MSDVVAGIVTAIASGAGGSIGSSGATALGRLIAALREKFHGDPSAARELEIAVESPSAGEHLAVVIRDRIASDPAFEKWLLTLWAEIAPQVRVEATKQENVISGNVKGHAIQARDIQGGINFRPG